MKVDELPRRFAGTDPASIEIRLDAVDHEVIGTGFCHRDGVLICVLSHSGTTAEWPEGAGCDVAGLSSKAAQHECGQLPVDDQVYEQTSRADNANTLAHWVIWLIST